MDKPTACAFDGVNKRACARVRGSILRYVEFAGDSGIVLADLAYTLAGGDAAALYRDWLCPWSLSMLPRMDADYKPVALRQSLHGYLACARADTMAGAALRYLPLDAPASYIGAFRRSCYAMGFAGRPDDAVIAYAWHLWDSLRRGSGDVRGVCADGLVTLTEGLYI